MSDTKIIALAGKGGVGKTSLAAVMVKLLTERYPDKKILAIDADPAVGLSTALGVEVKTTIDDIRKEVVSTVEDGDTKTALELLGEARYRIFDALVEQDGFSFIAVGRPEAAGCYCKINSYLKEVIGILSQNFDYVVIDGEAGIEQINRRVMEKVTHLVLITDPSRKGTQVIDTIRKVADELVMYERCGVIVNRLSDPALLSHIRVASDELLAVIPTDDAHAVNDIEGRSVFGLDEDSPIMKGAREALIRLGLLNG